MYSNAGKKSMQFGLLSRLSDSPVVSTHYYESVGLIAATIAAMMI
jgi:hypothetical protein